jgi:protein ImuB
MSLRQILSLDLPVPVPAPSPVPAPVPTLAPVLRPVLPAAPAPVATSTHRRSVWLAIHLRGWQLHATLMQLASQERELLSQKPLAVVEDDRRGTLVACNALAHARGVRVGHSLNAAIALCAEMQFLPRQPASETELLRQIATECDRYTPFVSLEPPNELLLEVRGSVRLFGGIDGLIEQVRADFARHGLATAGGMTAQLAMTPTPQSALWFARAAREPIVVRPRQLVPSIAALPVSFLLWPAELELRLARFGVLSIGDLLRLPRAGLDRRIGHERLEELDHAVGRHRQVRRRHRVADLYSDRVLLDFEIETTGLLSTILEARFGRLAHFLAKRTLATDKVHIILHHRDTQATQVTIGLAAPTSDTAHVAKLMHEQLTRLELPAPVVEATIRVDRLLPQPSGSRDLFDRTAFSPASASTEPQARLLEQLRSRLGERGIRQLALTADHRPECANEIREATVNPGGPEVRLPPGMARRPLWLLPTPRRIPPSRRMSASIVSGPEAIEGGWWDGLPAQREYFVARSARGALAWIFRERAEAPLFVHGLFG